MSTDGIEHDDDQIVVFHDTEPHDLIKKINAVLKSRGLKIEDVSEDGADYCTFELQDCGTAIGECQVHTRVQGPVIGMMRCTACGEEW
jgi:hypothetical protein